MDNLLEKIDLTFKSILYINWILVAMGVTMFIAAVISALGFLRFDIAALLSLTGFGNIFAMLKFSMNRLLRNLGDHVHIETVCNGYDKQIVIIENHNTLTLEKLKNVESANDEVRKAVSYSMEMIQNFTEIGKPLKEEEPWVNPFPIRYGELKFSPGVYSNGERIIYLNKEFTISGTITNIGRKPIELAQIVIAIRPRFGTPKGGPFRFDFLVDNQPCILKPGETITREKTKFLDDDARNPPNKQIISKDYLGADWYAFMTCRPKKDNRFHDDENNYWFEVKA